MPTDFYQVIGECEDCARNSGTRHTHKNHLKLFPANGSSELIDIDLLGTLLGTLPKTKKGNQHVLVLTDRYSKLKMEIPMKNTTASHVETSFVESWAIPY